MLLLSLRFLLLLSGGVGVGSLGIFAVGGTEGSFAFFGGSGHVNYSLLMLRVGEDELCNEEAKSWERNGGLYL